MSKSLKKQVITSIAWSSAERFSVLGAQFVLTIILSRLVEPSEFGLIAMLGIFLAIARTFTDSGFSNALIQKKNRTETDYSTVFYFNIAIACIVYLALFAGSSFIAEFYKEPQLSLVMKWVGLSIVIAAFAIVQRTKLAINLNFKIQTAISLSAIIVSGAIGVLLAYYGYGVWALVAQTLLNNFLNTLLLWILAKWKPALVFSWQSFKTLFSFGSKLLLGGLIHTIYINLYSLVIGRRYSAADVGYYNQAHQISMLPSGNMMDIISRVMFPVQCRWQDDERLSTSFMQYLRMACYVIFPLMIGLAVLAKPLILLLLTEKWLPAADLLSIICLAYMWAPVTIINHQIITVKGRSDYNLRNEIVRKLLGIGILAVTIPWGLKALCWGLVVSCCLDMVIIIYYTKKVIDTGYIRQLKNVAPIFLLSAAMGGLILLSTADITNVILQLTVGIATGVFSYAVLSSVFRVKEFIRIASYIRKIF
jgi:O-antigen/teichoic acid export membrane protein